LLKANSEIIQLYHGEEQVNFQYNYITINSNGRQDNKLQHHELHFWQNSNFQTQNSQRQKTKKLLVVTWTRAQMGDGINLLNEISKIYQIV